MKRETDLSQERLRELLSYDQTTGIFTWRVDANWKRRSGDKAGHLRSSDGYMSVKIEQRHFMCHRLAVLYMTGEFPSLEVDHKDCDRSNNRWSNLRLVTNKQNKENGRSGMRRHSLRRGVTWLRGKWRSRIYHFGVETNLGLFETIVDAVAARIAAERRLFTHANQPHEVTHG